MLVYMIHPNHGTHIAYTPQEVEDCLKNGWTFKDAPKENTQETEKPKKRPGRPRKS